MDLGTPLASEARAFVQAKRARVSGSSDHSYSTNTPLSQLVQRGRHKTRGDTGASTLLGYRHCKYLGGREAGIVGSLPVADGFPNLARRSKHSRGGGERGSEPVTP